MICAIAEIESDRQPLAYRFEPKLKEASTGLMQMLQSTAEWLAR
jgi:soluble lytic murein transglycosylase-like protein